MRKALDIHKNSTSIFWFRHDLRLSDNPALLEACTRGKVLAIYILKEEPQPFTIGAASRVYLHHSLDALHRSLNDCLNLYVGDPEKIIFQLIEKYNVEHLFWNRCYEPCSVSEEESIERKLDQLGINHTSFNGSYLWEPDAIHKEDGSYYKVFSAYKRKLPFSEPRKPLPAPENALFIKEEGLATTLDHLKLMSGHPWENKITKNWTFGEAEAGKQFTDFVQHRLSGYKKGRDYPAEHQTSNMSAALHFGEISPNQIWHRVINETEKGVPTEDIEHFLSEMIWREFSCYLMVHFKGLPSDNFQAKFDEFPWKRNPVLLKAWKEGKTGYPLVDAGMRQLWQTGFMHNRIRMVVGSFLVKNLMIHWHEGRDWFWECLIDADLANNSFNWQWVAGCGADAAPYFRIFNPITQGEKFDPEGDYTRKFVPELKALPNKYLFKPWEAPEAILQNAAITLGIDYPKPIVDLQSSRKSALSAYTSLSQ